LNHYNNRFKLLAILGTPQFMDFSIFQHTFISRGTLKVSELVQNAIDSFMTAKEVLIQFLESGCDEQRQTITRMKHICEFNLECLARIKDTDLKLFDIVLYSPGYYIKTV